MEKESPGGLGSLSFGNAFLITFRGGVQEHLL